MNFLEFLFDPAIIVVLVTFTGIMTYFFKKTSAANKELLNLLAFVRSFNKADMAFRFKEMDDVMSSNPYISNSWAEFRNTLMFSESLSLKNENDDVVFQDISQSITTIQTTVDPVCFFNEETLVTSKFNHKFIQAAPTLLTGLGPLFTFLNIGIAFSHIDFSTQETTIKSVSSLMGSMQIAATVSVLAVGASLLFIFTEKLLYNMKCKAPLAELLEAIAQLFDNISSEKFLIELLKETKIQNNNTKNLLSAMPVHFQTALDKSLSRIMVPYLENIVFGLNKIQEKTVQEKKEHSDVVDDLF